MISKGIIYTHNFQQTINLTTSHCATEVEKPQNWTECTWVGIDTVFCIAWTLLDYKVDCQNLGKQDTCKEEFRKGHLWNRGMSEKKKKKKTLKVLSIPVILFLNLANIRTAVFRIKTWFSLPQSILLIWGINKVSGRVVKFVLSNPLLHLWTPPF